MTIKIKNRNHYDIVYECLVHCRDYEKSETFPTTKSRFVYLLGGNSKVAKNIIPVLVDNGLVEVNKEVEHYSEVFKITEKGLEYIVCYEEMRMLLGYEV